MDKIKKLVPENPTEDHLSAGEVLRGKLNIDEARILAFEPSPD